jgi:hypothetical protein
VPNPVRMMPITTPVSAASQWLPRSDVPWTLGVREPFCSPYLPSRSAVIAGWKKLMSSASCH